MDVMGYWIQGGVIYYNVASNNVKMMWPGLGFEG